MYRKQALIYHPDKAPTGKQEEYKILFQEINEAFQTLSNINERAWYDKHREEYLNPHRKNVNFDGFSFKIEEFLI